METTSCEEKHLDKLDLDAPLMSTRRLCSNTSTATSNATAQTKETSRRVPFLWERAAGVPFVNSKEEESEDEEEEEEILPPKPPPGQYRYRSLSTEEIIKVEDDASSVYDVEDEVFLDALDNLSISESMSNSRRSPSFIMDRFLPAATAIAASSSSTIQQVPKKMKRRRVPCSHPHEQPSPEWLKKPRLKQQHYCTNSKLELQQCVPGSQSPSKACGLMVFFPWSLKHNLCGFKSATPPVRCRTTPMSVSVSVRGSLRCSNDQMVRWKEDDQGYKMSSKACQSPGWGLPFLNSTSSRVSKRTRFVDDEMREKGRSLMFNPPQLKPPTDSWLQHALTKKLK